jgi:hypothetical protein
LSLNLHKQHNFIENVKIYDITKKIIWWQPLTAWTNWFVTGNGESIKRVVWHLVLIVWSNRIINCSFYLHKINIFWFSWITRLKQDATRHIWYFIFLLKMTFKLKGSVDQEFSFKKMLILWTFLTKNYFLCNHDKWILY